MRTPPRVIGIGHVTCDIVCPLDGWPAIDTKTVLPGIMLAGGGPTANTLAGLARLGIGTAIVGQLSDDVLGRYTLEAHRTDGVDISHLRLDPAAVSPVSVLLSDLAAGTRTIFLTKGGHTQLDPDVLDLAWLAQAQVLHFDGHQLPASLAAAKAAQGWPQVTCVLDAGSLREGMLELAKLCDVVIASRRFASDATGESDPTVALRALAAKGFSSIGITCGKEGSYFMDHGQVRFQQAYVVNTQDTTGAGDAFQAGYIYGLLQCWPIAQRLRWASAVAALKCKGLGARSTLPSVNEVEQFLKLTENPKS